MCYGGCNCKRCNPPDIPSPLTREQVEYRCKNIRDIGSMDWEATQLEDHDAALRRIIEQQAQEIARLTGDVKDQKAKQAACVAELAATAQERAREITRLEKQYALQKEVADNQTWHVQDLTKQLAAMTTERDLLQHRFDDAIEAIDRLQKEQQDVYHERG